MRVNNQQRHRARKPRGEGTYISRVICQINANRNHDVTVLAGDDSAWEMARALAYGLHEQGYQNVRCLISHFETPYLVTIAETDSSGQQVEDDILF